MDAAKRGGNPAMSNPFLRDPGAQYDQGMKNVDKNAAGTIEGQRTENNYALSNNRPNVETSQGNESWNQNPDGTWTRKYTENQNLQGIRSGAEQGDLQTGQTINSLGQQAGRNFSQAYNLGGAPQVPGSGDRIGERQRVENSLIGRFDEVNQPQFQKQRQTLLQELADQGIAPGSKQYNDRLSQLDMNQQNTRRDYATSAIQFGGSEMERSNNLATGDYNRYVDQYDRERYAPTNEMSALGQANAQRPRVNDYQFSPMSQYNPVDVGGTVGQWNSYDVAKRAAARSGGGGGGGTSALDNQLIGFGGSYTPSPSGPSTTQNLVRGVGQGLGTGLAIGGQTAATQRRNAFLRNP